MTDIDTGALRDTIAEWARRLYNLSSAHSTEDAETYESVLRALNRELDRLAELERGKEKHFEAIAEWNSRATLAEARATAAEEDRDMSLRVSGYSHDQTKAQLAQARAALDVLGTVAASHHEEGRCMYPGCKNITRSMWKKALKDWAALAEQEGR